MAIYEDSFSLCYLITLKDEAPPKVISSLSPGAASGACHIHIFDECQGLKLHQGRTKLQSAGSV